MSDILKGLAFLPVALFFFYEWLAVSFPVLKLPSYSAMTYGFLAGFHPLVGTGIGLLLGAGVVLLFEHLTGNLDWWRP